MASEDEVLQLAAKIQAKSKPPVLERLGSGWKCQVVDATIEVLKIKERSESVWAEVAVYRRGDRRRILNLNLGAPTSVAGWANKVLLKHWDDFPLPWEETLVRVLDMVIDASRCPTPLINLGSYERNVDNSGHLIAPLFPYRDITILFGRPGGSKSRIALANLLCYTEGLSLPGLSLSKPRRPGIYFDFEWTEEKHAERLEGLCHWLQIDPPKNLYYRRIRRRLPDEIDAMKRQVDELGAGFVVIDSLGLAARGNMQSDEVALEVMGAILELDVTTCVVGQITKGANNGETKASPFGSIFWEYSARQTWEVNSTKPTEDSETVTAVLWSRKTNGKPIRRPVAWEITQVDGFLGFETTEATFKAEAEDESLCDAIAVYLQAHTLATTKEIAFSLARQGIGPDEVRSELHRQSEGRRRDLFVQADMPGAAKLWKLR
jgi:hypothetical protein